MTLDVAFVGGQGRAVDLGVKFIGFVAAIGNNRLEVIEGPRRELIGQAQLQRDGLTRAGRHGVIRGSLRADPPGIYPRFVAPQHVIVKRIFHIGGNVGDTPQPVSVRFILGEQQLRPVRIMLQ